MKKEDTLWYKSKKYKESEILFKLKCENVFERMTEAQLKDFYIRYK